MAKFVRGSVAVSSARNPFDEIVNQPLDCNLIRDSTHDSLGSNSLQSKQSWEENAQVYPESRITELASQEAQYFTANMDKMYPVKQRMALPGAKPPKAPFLRQSLNNLKAVTQRTPSPSSRLTQPPSNAELNNQGLFRSGRDPIRRKKPVPMPRTFVEMPIDVPQDFEIAAYAQVSGSKHDRHSLKPNNINNSNNQHTNGDYHRSSQNRPKSMMEGMNPKEAYRTDWTKIDEEVEIIETSDEIDVWFVDHKRPVNGTASSRTHAKPTAIESSSTSNNQHIRQPHQYSTSLEGGLNKMGVSQSKPIKAKRGNKKKISESVPNLEEIQVHMPPRLSLDQKVLHEIDEDSDALYRNCEHSSSIELNSILHRESGFFISKCSDAKSVPFPGAPEVMNNDFEWYTQKNKLDGFEMKVKNPILVKKKNNLAKDLSSSNSSNGRFNRFSKSIQNLFNFNESRGVASSGGRGGGRKSVSEVNLTKIKKGRGTKVGDSNVLGTPYCPSSWFTMKTNLKRNATLESPKGPFRRAWKKYKSIGLFKRSTRNVNSKR